MRRVPRSCFSKGKSRSPEWQYRVSTCQRPEEREPAAFSDPNNCKPALPIGATGTWCIGRDVSSWHFCMDRPCVASRISTNGGWSCASVSGPCIERLCSWPSWISARTRSYFRKGLERPLVPPDLGYDGETVSPSPQSNSRPVVLLLGVGRTVLEHLYILPCVE